MADQVNRVYAATQSWFLNKSTLAPQRGAHPVNDVDVVKRFCVVGPGRAGLSFVTALRTSGWTHLGTYGRSDDLTNVASGVDLVLLAVPDGSIADVAAAISPVATTVLCHVSGSRTLSVLEPHQQVGSLHPLMSLPNAEAGAARLLDSCAFAVCGSPLIDTIVSDLSGRSFSVADKDRATYHATASIAANHLVALCGQVERLASQIGAPSDAFWKLMTTSLANASELGAAQALTGPAARGDWDTIQGHLNALPPAEQTTYVALAQAAASLADNDWPANLRPATDQ